MEDMELVMDVLLREQPMISFYRSYRYLVFGELVTSVEFEYHLTEDHQNAVNEEILHQVDRIADYARSVGKEPIAQTRAVYEYFSTRIEYDDGLHSYAFNSAGALIYGRAVCMGIALGFKLTLDALGIPSILINGDHDGESHAWSTVYLDGEWLLFDVTVGVCRTVGVDVCYDGFCTVPSPEMYRPRKDLPLPKFRIKEGI